MQKTALLRVLEIDLKDTYNKIVAILDEKGNFLNESDYVDCRSVWKKLLYSLFNGIIYKERGYIIWKQKDC